MVYRVDDASCDGFEMLQQSLIAINNAGLSLTLRTNSKALIFLIVAELRNNRFKIKVIATLGSILRLQSPPFTLLSTNV